eukprot:532445-Rhodomonas_salina.1
MTDPHLNPSANVELGQHLLEMLGNGHGAYFAHVPNNIDFETTFIGYASVVTPPLTLDFDDEDGPPPLMSSSSSSETSSRSNSGASLSYPIVATGPDPGIEFCINYVLCSIPMPNNETPDQDTAPCDVTIPEPINVLGAGITVGLCAHIFMLLMQVLTISTRFNLAEITDIISDYTAH